MTQAPSLPSPTRFLVFSLVAPMGAFGGPAGHEMRATRHWPARSAILGLLGAAKGVFRDDRAGQIALARWQMAIELRQSGQLWEDFHTVQTVPASRIKRPRTRRAALSALKRSDNGVLTRREYISDCAFSVALWGGSETDPAALDDLAAALNRPHFVPYLGRKSCPLSAPMAAQVVTTDGITEALSRAQFPPFLPDLPAQLRISDVPLGTRDASGAVEVQELVWDVPLDRETWHFGARMVHVTGPEEGA